MRPPAHFLQSCFSMFFEVSIFLDFVWFGLPGDLILGGFLEHFSENTKVCLDCTGVSGLHIQPLKIEAFSRSFSRVDFGRPLGEDF